MRTFIELIAIACLASLVVAAIPDIPVSDQPFATYGWQGYPWPEEMRVRSTAETAKILSENKATPLQTMLLIYQTTDTARIFKDILGADFEYLNEYPQYDAEGECFQEELDDKTELCDRLENSRDESLLYQNLHDLCVDLKAKITKFCADKIKPLSFDIADDESLFPNGVDSDDLGE